eukprot:snap_masked-scaffold_19-processed-gene-6.50-mRNA-1 protein AED:1.00 eAED:1.00 QI:0/0/0/0/1/1/6/0/131
MKYDEKSILRQYEERRNTNEFWIIWSNKDGEEAEKFNKAIKTFLQSMKVNNEITTFFDCPLFVFKETFERLLNLFPVVDYLEFNNCTINDDTFNILSKPKIFPKLKEIDFTGCEIISFESFDIFISKRIRV